MDTDMELDPDEIFGDDEDDPESDAFRERVSTKELAVYLVDASPKMFLTRSSSEEDANHFNTAMSCILSALKTQIVSRSTDEIAICFFNTREKKNLQDLSGVFVFNVDDRESLDRPTAKLIKELSQLEERFAKEIGSQYGIVAGSRENSLYSALWVAQALLRKGSVKTADKRILLFTNEDDPFGNIKGATRTDMTRTTLQRAKDAQDLGISIELLPLSVPNKGFDPSCFYADLVGIEDNDDYMSTVGERFEDMEDGLRKRMFKKRIVRKLKFTISDGFSIDVNTYALVRPTLPGAIVWLDSISNQPLKIERSFICADTGALIQEPTKRFHTYKNMNIQFSVEELSEIKRVSACQLQLLGFKPLNCLKAYHNLSPSTFLFPTDEELHGSSRIFVALHRSMLRLKRFALAFYGNSSRSRLVAIVAQDEVKHAAGQVEPPGMHMIYLPYADDIRPIEEFQMNPETPAPRASDDQVDKAAAVIKRIDLKGFNVCQLSNPALQRHYAILQALALEEDELPEIKDETLPDEEGLSRPAVTDAVEAFKVSIYGDKYEARSTASDVRMNEASKKRKANAGDAVKECEKYDWAKLAQTGKLMTLTVAELKYYLTAHSLPLAGRKEDLINRIKTHLRK